MNGRNESPRCFHTTSAVSSCGMLLAQVGALLLRAAVLGTVSNKHGMRDDSESSKQGSQATVAALFYEIKNQRTRDNDITKAKKRNSARVNLFSVLLFNISILGFFSRLCDWKEGGREERLACLLLPVPHRQFDRSFKPINSTCGFVPQKKSRKTTQLRT